MGEGKETRRAGEGRAHETLIDDLLRWLEGGEGALPGMER